MGYRHYFYLAKKEDVERVHKMTMDEYKALFKDEYDYIGVTELLNAKEVFGFGKLYFCDTAERIYNYSYPLFEDTKLFERFEEYAAGVGGKEMLMEAINIYKQKIIDNSKHAIETLENSDKDSGEYYQLMQNIQLRYRFNLIDFEKFPDIDNKYAFTDSWNYDKSIFNLGLLLKTIDFNTHELIFIGY